MQTPQRRLQSKLSPSLALTPSKFLPSIKSDKNRIGILRRPEGISPTIESDTHITKTLTAGSANVEQHSEVNVDLNTSFEKSIHNTTFRTEPKQCEFELRVPETVPLKSSLLHEIGNTGPRNVESGNKGDERNGEQHFEDAAGKPRDIPYWLRPTPVQPYPYNFIMAVRKKLESITHPVVSVKPRQWPNPTEHPTFHSPLPRPDTLFESHYRRNLERHQSESEKSTSENVQSLNVSPTKSSAHIEHSAGQQEYSMDFSSVTFESKRDRSHVLSESKRKSVGASQDTLSISSGILSHSSPEKKIRTVTTNGTKHLEKSETAWQPSPLTTDNVDGLQITSRSLTQNERISDAHSIVSHQSVASSAASHINFGRGRDYNGRGLPSFRQLSKKQSFEQLLDDFKSSLSAAIEANQHLRHLLSNPPSSRLAQYSDGFEHTTENEESHISERITGTNESGIPSYKSQYTNSSAQSNGRATIEKNGSITKNDKIEVSNVSTLTKVLENVTSNLSTSKQSHSQRNGSNNFEESLEKEKSSSEPKESSTMIEEKIDDYQSSESPTNNDLKSVSLSIAKKSAPTTSDDTDQPSNAIESFNKHITGEPDVANESIGTDIFNIFNKTGMNLMEDVNQSIWSEHNISYSTLGMV